MAITGSALAAGGVFQTGASVGPEVPPNPRTDVGVAIPGSARLLALRVADPAGGPPWGLRTIRTTRGLICVQLGRIVGDRIGALGRDGAFKDDGRFHPLSVDYLNVGGFNCGVEDARGNAFLNEEDFALPAAGLLGGGRDVSGGCYTSPKTRAGCGPGDLRDVSYGLLGPAARAITSRSSDGSLAGSATAGPDGAYLVVLTHVEHRCAEQTLIDCVPSPGGETGGPALDVSGAVRSVSYRDGSTCHLMTAEDVAHAMKAEETRFRSVLRSRYPALYHRVFVGQNYRPGALAGLTPREARVFNATHRPFSHGFEHFSCPVVGYSPLRTSPVTSSQVAAPIHVRFEPSAFYCETPGRELAPCARRAPAGYRRIPSPRGHREELVVISFRTRIPIENYDRHYEINISYPGSAARTCPLDAAGEFGPSNSDFAAGAEVRFAQFFDTLCPGDYHVRIDLIGTSGPAGAMPVPGLPGQRHEGEVGRTHIRVR
ncbi:MAG TPA: hypothetical protein VGN13_07010 [Solirubrobacteraceae bacterium]